MSTKRQWDESRSPQWKYLLGKESNRKRQNRRHSEKAGKENPSSSEDEQLLYPLYRKRALTKAERRERKLKQLKELNMPNENSK